MMWMVDWAAGVETRKSPAQLNRVPFDQLCKALVAGGRVAARRELSRQPRDASATRLRNRDVVDGRPRAVYRKFGLSRIRLREMAHRGQLPGITKSSW
jgi:ribosomal protein S14